MNITSVSPLLSQSMPKAPVANAPHSTGDVKQARELKEAFTQFVGETFFGQMLKSMRQTVQEPAYFHGGMAEEQFQARLDLNSPNHCSNTNSPPKRRHSRRRLLLGTSQAMADSLRWKHYDAGKRLFSIITLCCVATLVIGIY
jgi:hypothetical protein